MNQPPGNRRSLGLLALAFACTLPAIYFPSIHYSSRTLARIHDFAHVPLFTLMALILCAAWPGGLFRNGRLRPLPAMRLWLATVLAGMLVELAQARQGRFPELADVVADAAGATIALALASGMASKRWRRAGILAGSIFLITALPVAVSAWDEMMAHRAFPVIADFESRWQVDRFKRAHSILKRVADDRSPGNHVMEVRFLPDQYPRLSLRDLPRDWSPYSAFIFTCINPNAETFILRIRIDDIHHDNRPADRFILDVPVVPGRQQVEVPLNAVANALEHRLMDMQAIAQVTLYGYRVEEPVELLFDDFRLLPADVSLP